MSKRDFESMMISKFINIKTTKNVIAMIWLNLRWYEFLAENRDKVRSTKNGIHMNDGKVRLLAPNKTGAHHPHASSLIWHVPYTIKPAYNRTWILFSLSFEREKTKDMGNVHATHAFKLWVSDDEHTIIPGSFLSPRWCGPNIFTTHATNTTKVAWCVESR